MSRLIVSTIERVDSVDSQNAILDNSMIGQDLIVLSPTTHQNNYNLGIQSSNQVHSIVNLYPGNTCVFSGIDTSGFAVNKRFTLRNCTNSMLANSYLIVLNRSDPDSTSANQFYWNELTLPGWLMPGEEMHFIYDGTKCRLTGGTRYSSGVNIYDQKWSKPSFDSQSWNGGGSSWNSGNIWHPAYHSAFIHDTRSSSSQGSTFIGYGLYPGTTVGLGSMLVTTAAIAQSVSSFTDDFIYYSGLSNAFGHDNQDINALYNPTSIIGVMYDIRRANDFILITGAANTFTTTALGATPVAYFSCRWAAFINGTGTRVDFLTCPLPNSESNVTKRNNWQKRLIIHTTNIPKIGNLGPDTGGGWGTSQKVGLTSVMGKRSGTTTRQYTYTALEGFIGGGPN